MDARKMSRSLKLAQMKVRNTLDVFNPSKYSPEVLKANKELWIKKVEDSFDVVAELSLDLEEFVSPEEAHEISKFNESLKNEISEFVFSINTSALSINDSRLPITINDVSEIQPKLNIVQNENENKRMNVSRTNRIQEEDQATQLRKCSESEPSGSILDSIKKLNDTPLVEIVQTQVEYPKNVQSVFQNLLKFPSVNPYFRGQLFNYDKLRSVLLMFPIQEMHVMLQMSSGSIQRRLDCIFVYIPSVHGCGSRRSSVWTPTSLSSMNVLEEPPLRSTKSIARALDREEFQPQVQPDV